jgi:hypothetical protein
VSYWGRAFDAGRVPGESDEGEEPKTAYRMRTRNLDEITGEKEPCTRSIQIETIFVVELFGFGLILFAKEAVSHH